MSIEEYNKLCSSLGSEPYDKFRNETDYGYFVGERNWLSNERFFSVCGYRAKKADDGSWKSGSLIFYGNNGFYRDEYYTDCDKAKSALIKEIGKFKQKVNEYRKRKLAMDFV